ncbi:MAG: hypothetical protein FJZ00_00420 [Candidatus Sericytochromatia bacterium]|uniref:Uncharacterized protein n=1 Tax=Candidatus Tanganyikabacteria bacterium TaxID=2961651 RepID=A0A937X3K4_9BACT|nr:hypothetical protein [Candidatus Tanganyikabacteria bacterium]
MSTIKERLIEMSRRGVNVSLAFADTSTDLVAVQGDATADDLQFLGDHRVEILVELSIEAVKRRIHQSDCKEPTCPLNRAPEADRWWLLGLTPLQPATPYGEAGYQGCRREAQA